MCLSLFTWVIPCLRTYRSVGFLRVSSFQSGPLGAHSSMAHLALLFGLSFRCNQTPRMVWLPTTVPTQIPRDQILSWNLTSFPYHPNSQKPNSLLKFDILSLPPVNLALVSGERRNSLMLGNNLFFMCNKRQSD